MPETAPDRWVTVPRTDHLQVSEHRHLVRAGAATSACGTTALPAGTWRPDTSKPRCPQCLAARGEQHVLHLGRTQLGQTPLAHINGAAGMKYGTTGRCSCSSWTHRVNVAPSSGGRRAVEQAHAQHVTEETAR